VKFFVQFVGDELVYVYVFICIARDIYIKIMVKMLNVALNACR